jgi:delta-1-pyrroline-5-carboxylate synthetase
MATPGSIEFEAQNQATRARAASRVLQSLTSADRSSILEGMASAIEEHRDRILEANSIDVQAATATGLGTALLSRLGLSVAKLDSVCAGIRMLARQDEPLGRVVCRRELAPRLQLEQSTVPIGVLLVIFESRPDCLPQVAALAIRSGNGLLLKGGKEATHSNAVLHAVLVDAIELASRGRVSRHVVGLVTSRLGIPPLLKMDTVIDLIIPRGSNALVSDIKRQTRIPVLGMWDVMV